MLIKECNKTIIILSKLKKIRKRENRHSTIAAAAVITIVTIIAIIIIIIIAIILILSLLQSRLLHTNTNYYHCYFYSYTTVTMLLTIMMPVADDANDRSGNSYRGNDAYDRTQSFGTRVLRQTCIQPVALL